MSTNVQADFEHLGYDIPRPVFMNGVVCPALSICRVCETECEDIDLAEFEVGKRKIGRGVKDLGLYSNGDG